MRDSRWFELRVSSGVLLGCAGLLGALLAPAHPRGQGLPSVIDLTSLGDGGAVLEAATLDIPSRLPGPLIPAGDTDGDGLADFFLRGTPVFLSGLSEYHTGDDLLIRGSRDFPRWQVADRATDNITTFFEDDPGVGVTVKAAPGDVDRDGFRDLLFVASDGTRDQFYEAYLVWGSPELRGEIDLLGPEGPLRSGAIFYFPDPAVKFASRVTSLDFNGDGERDLVFATPSIALNTYQGQVIVLYWQHEYGRPEAINVADAGATLPGFVLEGVEGAQGDGLGYAVGGGGDLNGDGLEDLVTSSFANRAWRRGEPDTAYIVFGSRSFPEHLVISELGSLGVTILGPDPIRGRTGFADMPPAAADLDGDGLSDLILGCHGEQPGFMEPFLPGRVYVILGRESFAEVLDLRDDATPGVLVLHAARRDDYAANAVGAAGDLNLDGFDDFLVGAFRATRGGHERAGEAYLIYGGPHLFSGSRERSLAEVPRTLPGAVATGLYSDDVLGDILDGLGDFNGDGVPDVAVGATQSLAFPERSVPGRLYIIYGRAECALELRRLEPDFGGIAGGYEVSLQGACFSAAERPQVLFAGRPAPAVRFVHEGELRVTVPPGEALGPVSVELRHGPQSRLLEEGFEYTRDFPRYDLAQPSAAVLRFRDSDPASWFAYALASGDLDGDGLSDVAVGWWKPEERWNVAVLYGSATPAVEIIAERFPRAGEEGFVLRGFDPEGNHEISLAAAGDTDGDGLEDLALGAYGTNEPLEGGTPGDVYVLLGSGEPPEELSLGRLGNWGFHLSGAVPIGAAGYHLASAGDFNGDGLADWVIGERGVVLPGGESLPGSAYVVLSGWGGRDFLRGDTDLSGGLELTDAVRLLVSLFRSGGSLVCEDAADANDDGALNLTDAVYSLRYQFAGGPPPPAPFPEPGRDPTPDRLRCGGLGG